MIYKKIFFVILSLFFVSRLVAGEDKFIENSKSQQRWEVGPHAYVTAGTPGAGLSAKKMSGCHGQEINIGATPISVKGSYSYVRSFYDDLMYAGIGGGVVVLRDTEVTGKLDLGHPVPYIPVYVGIQKKGFFVDAGVDMWMGITPVPTARLGIKF